VNSATTNKEHPIDVAALITRVENCPLPQTETLTHSLVLLMMAGAEYPGFWSGEINPPGDSITYWSLVQRFQTLAQLHDWQKSARRKDILAELGFSVRADLQVGDFIAENDTTGVATAIVTDVRPGMEADYFKWEEKIQIAQSKYAGYRGVYFQPPPPGRKGQWATLLRFDSPESLNTWFASEERLALLKEAEKFVTATKMRKVSNSFPGWVPDDAATGRSPQNWKTALLVLLGLYPVVLLEIRYCNPLLLSLNQALASFISLVGSVAATTFITMPLFVKLFSWWLYPGKAAETKTNTKGLLLLALLFVIEIATFSLLPSR
jgi:antibiotic biosynthesis monooxygenase (ABM) superfamily enzyme